MGTFAYVLLTHRSPTQVARLVSRLRALSPDAVLVVRHDAREVPLERAGIRLDGAEVHEYQSPLKWGEWSLVEAQLTELRWVRVNTDADYVSFLSGQDYPIASVANWERRVRRLAPDLLGSVQRIAYQPRWFRRGVGDHRARRAMYRYYPIRTTRFMRPLKLLGPLMDSQRLAYSDDLLVGVRNPLRGLQLWWAPQWLTLSARAASCVLSAGESAEAARRFHRAVIPDESFIATTIANNPEMRIVNEPLTHCRFPERSSHPVTFTSGDLAELMAADAPFARKFDDAVDCDVLKSLDERVDATLTSRS